MVVDWDDPDRAGEGSDVNVSFSRPVEKARFLGAFTEEEFDGCALFFIQENDYAVADQWRTRSIEWSRSEGGSLYKISNGAAVWSIFNTLREQGLSSSEIVDLSLEGTPAKYYYCVAVTEGNQGAWSLFDFWFTWPASR